MANKKKSASSAFNVVRVHHKKNVPDQSSPAPRLVEDHPPYDGATDVYPLSSIMPDPEQPRHLVPKHLLQSLWEKQIGLRDVMVRWQELATVRDAEKNKLASLSKLADSISQHGLINPITIRVSGSAPMTGIKHLIVTGERRFWAHVILEMDEVYVPNGNDRFPIGTIRANMAPPGINVMAHQLIENMMREDLSVIDRAWGLWSLRYIMSNKHLIRDDYHGSHSLNDSDLVSWKVVEETVQISRQYRHFVVNILNLSSESQDIVSEHNLPERVVRPVAMKLKKHDDLQVYALTQIAEWQTAAREGEGDAPNKLTSAVDDLVDHLLAQQSGKESASVKKISTPNQAVSFRQNVKRTLRTINNLKPSQWDAVITDISRSEDREEVYGDTLTLVKKLASILPKVSGDEQKVEDDIKGILSEINKSP